MPESETGDLRLSDFTAVPLAAACLVLGVACLVIGLLGFLFGVFGLHGARNVVTAGAVLSVVAWLLYRRAQQVQARPGGDAGV